MIDNALRSVATDLFDQHCSWDTVGEAAQTGWAPALWEALQQTGFSDVSVPEELGGAGGGVRDAIELLRVAGAHAAPVPLAESGLVGGWLLASAGFALPDGVRTVLPPGATHELRLDGDRLFGVAVGVPWAHRAQHLIGYLDGAVVLAPGPATPDTGPSVKRVVNLADEARDTVTFDGVQVSARVDAPDDVNDETLWQRIALGRIALMAGALDAVAAMTLRYSREREQFGRPIARFQAVQAHLVALHQQAAMVGAAVDGASEAMELGAAGFEIACAKLLADRAAQLSTAAAHQTHGAIGMTQEYPLHYLTRRLSAWRDEAGGHRRWADSLGERLVAAGPDALFPAIQGGSAVLG